MSVFTREGAVRRFRTAELTLHVGRLYRRRATLPLSPVSEIGTASATLHVEYIVRHAEADE